MVKVKGGCFSVHANGTLAGTLTFQKSLATPSAKSNKFKPYRRSAKQDLVRKQFSWSVSVWHSLPAATRQAWNEYTHYSHLYGYHAFIKLFFERTYTLQYQYELPPTHGFCVVGNHISGEFHVGGFFQTSTYLNEMHDSDILDILISYWYFLPYQLKFLWAWQDLDVDLVSRYQFIYINNDRIKAALLPYEHPDGWGFCMVGSFRVDELVTGGRYYPLW